MRAEFSTRVKRAAYARAAERCEACGAPLVLGKIDFDHIIPDALTGRNDLDNCMCVCRQCHRDKTKRDMADIAKAKRREAKHLGIRKPPAFRDPRWRKRMDGTVVERTPA